MRIYDTMARAIRDFVPLEAGKTRIYTCGPTVYRYAHIGNLRTYIFADLLRRAFEFEGFEVTQIVNITDVGHMTDEIGDSGEDRMMIAVEDEGLTPEEIAVKYTDAFLRDCKTMNIKPATRYPKASDHIPEMIDLIAGLVERGHAYHSGGGVYFEVDTFPEYGKLSHNTRDRLEAGHRIEATDPKKKRHYDFLLWRPSEGRRVMKWESPWGEGFPGWHIECSAMSIKYLGERFDIHTGGSDHIFPHHEDEIAQSEGAIGHQVVNYWAHAHHLLSEGRRMAKSARNEFLVADLLERSFDPLAFRYLVMQVRYRSQMNFTWDALASAERGLEKLRKQVAEWAAPGAGALSPAALDLDRRFSEAIADDLDMPRALTVVSEVSSSSVAPSERVALLQRWDEVLGLDLSREVMTASELPPGAAGKIEARERARAEGDFVTADRIRKELAGEGIELIDTEAGTRWVARPN